MLLKWWFQNACFSNWNQFNDNFLILFISEYDFWLFFHNNIFQENVFSNYWKMSIRRKSTLFPSSIMFWKWIGTFSISSIFGHMKFQEIRSKRRETFYIVPPTSIFIKIFQFYFFHENRVLPINIKGERQIWKVQFENYHRKQVKTSIFMGK